MNGLKRYHLTLVARPDPDHYCFMGDPPATEKVVRCNITADCEEVARRTAVARASYNCYLVSQFLSVKARTI